MTCGEKTFLRYSEKKLITHICQTIIKISSVTNQNTSGQLFLSVLHIIAIQVLFFFFFLNWSNRHFAKFSGYNATQNLCNSYLTLSPKSLLKFLSSLLCISPDFINSVKTPTQSAFTCSKMIIETLEQGVKYVQS